MAKVTAYQRKHPGVREMEIALEIVGVGVFANSTVALMRKWHNVSKVVKKIKKTLDWIHQIDFTRNGNTCFVVEEDPELPTILEEIPISSTEKTEILDLAAKECSSDQVMQMVLMKRFGADPNVKIVDPVKLGVRDGNITTETKHFRRALAGVTKEMIVLFPINCNKNH